MGMTEAEVREARRLLLYSGIVLGGALVGSGVIALAFGVKGGVGAWVPAILGGMMGAAAGTTASYATEFFAASHANKGLIT